MSSTGMHASARIGRRIFLIGASALALSACGGMIGPPDGGAIFTLRPAFPAAASGEKVSWALTLLRPAVPGGLDNDRIALLQPGGTLDYYAKANWPDRLPPLVQQAVMAGFQASGRIDAVAMEQDALHADYDLFLDVQDFEAKYSQADGIPEAVVVINAKLATAHGRKIIAAFTASHSQPAGANSAGAAAQALTLALAAAVTDIVNWTFGTAPAVPPGQSGERGAPETTVSTGKPAEQLLHETTRGTERLRGETPPR